MPPKQRKKAPREKKQKQTSSDSSTLTSPVKETTNYREIHLNEVEALRSIYGDDFEEVETRPSAWHQSSNVTFKIHLRASSNPDVCLVMRVELPATYPKTLPNISLQNIDEFREGARSHIQQIVRNKPLTLIGTEMTFEVAVEIQEILEDVAQAREQNKDLPSLEEERMKQEAAATQRAELKRQEEIQKQEAAAAAEESALQAMLQDKIRQRTRARVLRRKSRTGGADSQEVDDLVENTPGAIIFEPPVAVHDTEEQPLVFRAVHAKTLLRSRPNKKTFTVRPVVSESRCHVPLLVLKEIFLDEKGSQSSIFRENMRTSEDKLESLKKLRHPNLVEFVGFKIIRPVTDFNSPDNSWTVFTLFEFANKGSLWELLDIVGTVAVETLRGWMIQLLEALEFYHRSGFVHGNVHCGRVMICRTSSGSTIVKLQSSIEDAIPGFAGAKKRSLTSPKSPLWLPPELTEEETLSTMKTDIWDLGIVLLQMAFGKDVLVRYTSANQLMVSLGLSLPLQDLLNEFFRPDPRKRPTAFQLLPSEFFRVDSPLTMRERNSNSVSLQRRPRLDSIGAMPSHSRYHNEFDEAGHLGRGGFGQVVKARNKLDGRFYAVKKIFQSTSAALNDTLSEIMLLSRLNHPYVVRYYAAWLEHSNSMDQAMSSTEGDPFESQEGSEFSNSGLDFISSSGYPKIEFADSGSDGDEDDDEDDDEGTVSHYRNHDSHAPDDENSKYSQELSQSRSGSYGRPVFSTLYIQMEYCEKHTLRDLIKNGLYDDIDRSWRLFGQILDGLCHIHSNGIIHRDLKPDNIFIDVANNPRIGDFGLATSGQFTTAVRSSAAADFEDNFTRSLGTTYYVAPEMKSGFSGHYNEKVDMFSLGVIFFEMCYPLSTGMERDQELRAIREPGHTLPASFKQSERVLQGQTIESLLCHNPNERPTASELRQSNRIPLRTEDESVRRAMVHLLSDPTSPDYKKILASFFSQSPKKFEDIAWDMNSRMGPKANELLVRGLVKKKLTSVFRRHGAVESSRQNLYPLSKHNVNGVVRLLDVTGNLLQLPYDLTVPNARTIPRQDVSLEKTFAFGTVFRESINGGQPRGHAEVDFDIVSHDTLDLDLKEAEVIKVVDEIIEEFPSLQSYSMHFLVNHSDLLQLIMQFCRIKPAQVPLVTEVISKLNGGSVTMQKIRSQLRSPSNGVASTSLDDLARFDFRDTLEETQRRLQNIMEGTVFAERIPGIMGRLKALMIRLQSFGLKRKVLISPLGAVSEGLYRGSILFQCVYDLKRRNVFAAGGRYDHLVRDFSPSNGQQAHAVGFKLSADPIVSAMVEHLRTKPPPKDPDTSDDLYWSTRRCDVLVAGFDGDVLRTTGVKLLDELWANGISAELAIDASSLEELLARYREHNHRWIVLVKQDSKERGFKVRNLVRREEHDIRASELVPWLRSEVQARHYREGNGDIRQGRQPGPQDASQSNEKTNDVRILVPQHRSKKTNRRNVVESALIRSREIAEKAREGPIVAIDTRDDVLNAIRNTRLSDPESWRTVIQNAPLTERKYLSQVCELLTDLASEMRANETSESYTNAFIYNYRTSSCIYYDLGRKK